ncbi:trimethylamine corrinoid protein [Desulfitobacterium sp. LBE]|nr:MULTISPECIES: corrinoid protein [Desulfitobacterium]ACL22330.1 methyltransferase cognate corrinoid protein [Desulfitobacterium hafniense DCB-2]KTE92148.1 dimethylamine corrinoid protein 3 [Desulfitobacterium hafniense]MEA5021434.1 corrinoid protein [Desulfitobacterium hafniense]TWH59897.1 trimethylamine corrinoid protein [Desulfitobacterium sp. LBE]CDX03263.1 Methyltransferase corrinoid protein [Desulfitobacterium hafniense]
MSLLDELKQAIIDGDEDIVAELSQKAVDEDLDLVDTVQSGLVKGIEVVGTAWKEGEMFLPDVMMSAEAMKVGLAILEPEIAKKGMSEGESKGKIVLGTVEGDIHDIGKNITGAMFTAAGYKVIDLGTDIKAEGFVAKAQEVGADIIGASALLTTTMIKQKELIEYLKEKNLRDSYKVLVGGGPTSQVWADEIGADGWAETADDAVELANKILGK